MKNIGVVILAAGKGTRLNNGKPAKIPKVLHEIGGRPMIEYGLDTLKRIGFLSPIIVVGYKADLVRKKLGADYKYALQKEQLGTGHAVAQSEKQVLNQDYVLVLNGDDSAFYQAKTLEDLVKKATKSESVVTLLTMIHPSPEGLGRIIREKGKFKEIVEEKDANPAQKKIKEINAGCYVFKRDWLFKNLSKIKLSSKGEYYLTDLIEMAVKEGKGVEAVKITDHSQWIGINTPEDLQRAHQAKLRP